MHFHSITFVCVACTRNECKSEREEKREKPLSVPALNTATNSFDWWEFVQCLFESDRQSILVKVEKIFLFVKKMVINFAAGPAKLPDEVSWET